MTIENVRAFYKKLAKDQTFKIKIEGSQSKQECSQIAREAGFDFTQEEFEEFTAQLLDSDAAENYYTDELSEEILEAVLGGIKLPPVLIYGLPPEEY